MNILEMYAGSRSIGKAAEAEGHTVFSIDIEAFPGINLVTDIMDLTKEQIPFIPNMIWASPPCTAFSVASMKHHWHSRNRPRTEQAVFYQRLVIKTIEVFSWFPEAVFFMENPMGMLRVTNCINTFLQHQDHRNLKRHTVTYCQYGFDYMKPTDIWTNSTTWKPRPRCKPRATCHQAAPRSTHTGGLQSVKNAYLRAVIPPDLCKEIIQSLKPLYNEN